jgi:Family of unknown function (DUF6220)
MAGTSGTTAPAPGGTRSRSPALYRAYHWTLGVFLVCGAVQIFLAGLGVFPAGDGPGIDPHRWFALVLAGIAFVAVVLAALARAGGRAIGLCVLLFVLVFLVQGFLAVWGREQSAWFGGLHALDGLLIIGLAGWLFGTSGRRPLSPPSAP